MGDGTRDAIGVVIVDPSRVFREALLALVDEPPDLVAVAEAATVREAAEVLPCPRGTTVVVTELVLPDLGGLDAIRLVRLLGRGSRPGPPRGGRRVRGTGGRAAGGHARA